MKAIVIAIIVIAAMVLLGWLAISRTGDGPAVSVDTDQIRADAEQAIQVTKEAGEKVASEGEDLVDEMERTEIDIDVHEEPATVEP